MTTNVWSRLKAERKKGRKEDELRRQPAGASTGGTFRLKDEQ